MSKYAHSHAFRILSFVPRVLLSFIQEHGHEGKAASFKSSRGAVLFADVSGFTKLSSSLESKGPKAGAEELTDILNGFLGDIIDTILEFKGDICKYAGDAIIAVWESDGGPDSERDCAVHAAACAYTLQKRRKNNTQGLK
eukprot:Colp12_sorted_trinity150504_noHs@3309